MVASKHPQARRDSHEVRLQDFQLSGGHTRPQGNVFLDRLFQVVECSKELVVFDIEFGQLSVYQF